MSIDPGEPVQIQSTVPAGARGQVAHYLAVVTGTEEQLRAALVLVAERHAKNFEIAHGATVCAAWTSEHLEKLRALRERYGAVSVEDASGLRAALFTQARADVVGELDDACDLAVLAQKAEMTWTILVQGARELHDDRLLDTASRARRENRRQLAWLKTVVEHEAPDAIAIVPGA